MNKPLIILALSVLFAVGTSELTTGDSNSYSSRLPSPRYIRSAEFRNQATSTATVTLVFESSNSASYDIASGESRVIEKTLDNGLSQSVDPIVSISVSVDGGVASDNDAAQSVEVRKYTINAGASLTRSS